MVKNILTASRVEAEHIIQKPLVPRMAIISITSYRRDIFIKGEAKARLQRAGCKNVLTMVFAEWSDETAKRLGRKNRSPLFRKTHAQKIITFLDYIREEDIDLLLINCDAGITRSGTVGVFAHRYLGTNDKYFRKHNKYVLPSPYVYDILVKESGLTGEFEDFWEKERVGPQVVKIF